MVLQNGHFLNMSVELSSHLFYPFYYFTVTGYSHGWFPPPVWFNLVVSHIPWTLFLTSSPDSEVEMEDMRKCTISRKFFSRISYLPVWRTLASNNWLCTRKSNQSKSNWFNSMALDAHGKAIFLLSSPLPSHYIQPPFLPMYSMYSCAEWALIEGTISCKI